MISIKLDVLPYIVLCLALLYFSFCIVLPTLIGLWERRLIWAYSEVPDPSTEQIPSDNSNPYAVTTVDRDVEADPYAIEQNRSAESLGFTPVAQMRHAKGGVYQTRYSVWRSPTGDVLLMIGWGTLASIPVRTSWLFSRISDGTLQITLDSQEGSEFDLTGIVKERLVARMPLAQQLENHRTYLALQCFKVVPFSQDQPLADLKDNRKRRADELVAAGYAKYINPERTVWRYGLRGAFVFSVYHWCKGMRRAFIKPDQ